MNSSIAQHSSNIALQAKTRRFVYVAATLASGNPMIAFAAIILGTVCALERRATGGVLAPILTHLVWTLVVLLALPPLFGL